MNARVFVYLGIIIMCYSGGNGKWQKVVRLRRKNTQKRARERTLKQNEIRTSLLTHDTVGAVRYCKMLLVVPRLAGVWFFENKPISIAVRIG